MPAILVPSLCPECSSPIEEYVEPRSKIITHWCNNEQCRGRLKDMLTFIADRHILEIEGLGPDMAEKLVADGFVVSLPDLFEFQDEATKEIARVGEDKF
jgi:NAD-dependent DNA ligase